MSSEEKLRALLAEARRELEELSRIAPWSRNLHERIDAALAEPVRGCESCGDKTYRELLDDNVRVRVERDEARAEVERLQERLEASAYEMARDMEPELVDGVVRAAYRRGAEAMREAAASIFDAPLSAPGREALLAWAESIRALPLPKEES